jgi:2-dehydropantoate 2-reductase
MTRHAVLGMGGVGGLIAATLAHAGDEVTAVVRPEGVADYPATIALESPLGTLTAPVRAAAAVVAPVDVVWIAVKATQLEDALAAAPAPELAGAIVPLLNGIDHVARLRRRFGDEKVVPATIAVEAERVAPGRFVRRSQLALLSVTAGADARLGPSLEKLARSGISTRTVPDEATLLWSKLVFLAPMALATSAAAATLGEVRDRPEWRARLETCVAEACAAALAAGAQVDAADTIARLRAAPASFRSSMQKDVAAGRPPELDAIAGPILAGGRDAPATRELVALVRGRL